MLDPIQGNMLQTKFVEEKMKKTIVSRKLTTFLFLCLFLSAMPLYAQQQAISSQGPTLGTGTTGVSESPGPVTGGTMEQIVSQHPPQGESDIEGHFATQTPDIRLTQFGYRFFQSAHADFAPGTLVPVGPNYVVGPGDEIIIRLWGLVENTFRMFVDRNGEIALPKLGVLHISGMALSDLKQYLIRKFSEYYKGFELDVSLGRLRSIQVYIVGEVHNPGTYTLTPLSTLFHALFKCRGPTKKGTLRDIRLIRQNEVIAHIDFYQFILKGDKSQDIRLEAEDTIFVPPIGEVVAITGNVKRPRIYELKGETDVSELIQMAGGTLLGGSQAKLWIERISTAHGDNPDLPDPPSLQSRLKEGDLVKIAPEMVTISGEVNYPGRYIIEKGEPLSAVIKNAGGFTQHAYLKGAVFTRESVRRLQRERLDGHIKELEKEILQASAQISVETLSAEAAEQTKEALAIKRTLLTRLKAGRVTGRIIVRLDELNRLTDSPYDIPLEAGDKLCIPPKPSTVAVIGEIYNPTSIIHSPGKKIEYYVKKVGGVTERGDKKAIYVVKADGTVFSKKQKGFVRWDGEIYRFRAGEDGNSISEALEPGDAILVPLKIERRVPIRKELLEWSQVMFHSAVLAMIPFAAF